MHNGIKFRVDMHELSVTQNVLDIALKNAGARRIRQVNLVVGQFSSIVDDSVQFYWDIIAKDTLAEGAKLHFRRVPAELQCMACFEKYHPDGDELLCPKCGSVGAKIIAGEEFYVEAIDID